MSDEDYDAVREFEEAIDRLYGDVPDLDMDDDEEEEMDKILDKVYNEKQEDSSDSEFVQKVRQTWYNPDGSVYTPPSKDDDDDTPQMSYCC